MRVMASALVLIVPCLGFETTADPAAPTVNTVKISPQDAIDGICKHSKARLKEIIDAARARGEAISVPMQAGREALAKAVYASTAQDLRKLGHTPPAWKGCTDSPEPTYELQMAETMMKGFDLDNDGNLTRKEVQTLIDHHNSASKTTKPVSGVNVFARIDKNGDGVADKEEVAALVKMFASSRSDISSQPKRSESQVHDEMFKDLDEDSDGVLSMNELYKMLDQNNMGEASNSGRRQAFFNTVDANGDGVVDYTEAMRFLTRTAQKAAAQKAE
jgi:Ca2+-binding EF-hand superfamily protein